jgi:hypothetical protein
MEIETGNRLIAEFMGWIHHEDPQYDAYEMSNLKYHSSLDSLMPVIEKVETLGYKVVLASYQAQVYDNNDRKMIIDADFSSKFLENAYGAVVGFITYYKNLNP